MTTEMKMETSTISVEVCWGPPAHQSLEGIRPDRGPRDVKMKTSTISVEVRWLSPSASMV